MSYGAQAPVIDLGQAIQSIAVAGVNLTALGAGLTVGAALLALRGIGDARDLVRSALVDTTAARGSTSALTVYRTGLVCDALPLFRTGLEQRNVRFVEGGSLQLAGEQQAALTYTAVGPHGIFFVRPGADGCIELLVQDQAVLGDVEGVLVETVVALARETLHQQGFTLTARQANQWTMKRRTADGMLEQVDFRLQGLRLTADAVTIAPNGRRLGGESCPNLDAFFEHFRSVSATASPLPPSGTEGGSASARVAPVRTTRLAVEHQSLKRQKR